METLNGWQLYLRAWRYQWLTALILAALALYLFWSAGVTLALGMAAIAALLGFFAAAFVGMAADW